MATITEYTNEEKEQEIPVVEGGEVATSTLQKTLELLENPTILNPYVINQYFRQYPNGDLVIGDYDGGQGIFWDQSEGTLNVLGGLTVDNLDIPDTTTADSFHTDADGNSWWGCNVADFTSDNDNAKAYVLKDGQAKFQDLFIVGSATENFEFDGTNLEATGLRIYDNFTAGENIADKDVVCTKPTYTDIYFDDDAYVDETPANANTNYGTEENLWVGQDGSGYNHYSYIKLSSLTSVPSSENILKATFRIYQYSRTSDDTIPIELVTTSWTEGAVTWNTKPTSSGTVNSSYGDDDDDAFTGAGVWLEYDVTQIVRQWKSGNLSNYGFALLSGSASPNAVLFRSSDYSGATTLKPHLRIYTTYEGDETIYKADADDYFTCRNIVGIAQEAITSGNSGKIQTFGQITNIDFGSITGGRMYLSTTAGGYLTSSNNLTRMISLGKIVTQTKAILNLQDQDILIEKLVKNDGTGVNIVATATKYYAPVDARYALIYFDCTATANSTQFQVKVFRESLGIEDLTIKDYSGAAADENLRINWSSNYIELTPNVAGDITIAFYT